MPRRVSFAVLLLAIGSGCADRPPVIADGKPVQHWLSTVRSPEPRLRAEAVKKLGNIGTKDDAALPAVFQALDDSDAAVRKEAIYAVVRNARASAPALPVLARMKSEDPDAAIRQLAAESYGNLKK